MKYKYSGQWIEDYGTIYTPRLTVVFRNPKNGMEMPVFCLVDSGADDTLLNPEIGKALGLDIESGQAVRYGGVGGEVVGYKHELDIRVAGSKKTHSIECAFASVGSIDALLGQNGFFDNFKVIFERYKKQFEILPAKK